MTELFTDEQIELDLYEDTDDGKEHLTHIINPPRNIHIWHPGMSSKDVVDIARWNGIEITALCGYRFIPKRNPEKYPACQSCFDIAGAIMSEDG